MMGQLWNGKRFPLLDRLNVAIGMRRSEDAVVYSGSACGVNTEKLGYFALSVIWRAGIRLQLLFPSSLSFTTSIMSPSMNSRNS